MAGQNLQLAGQIRFSQGMALVGLLTHLLDPIATAPSTLPPCRRIQLQC